MKEKKSVLVQLTLLIIHFNRNNRIFLAAEQPLWTINILWQYMAVEI